MVSLTDWNPNKVDVWRGWDMEPYSDFESAPNGYVTLDDYAMLLGLYDQLKWMYEGLCK